MRSFSKAFGLAGARIGYIVSNKKIKVFSNTKAGMKQTYCQQRSQFYFR